MSAPDFEMQFDIGTIRHLGLQMYSTLPPVIGELVSNAWDADAEKVEITIPTQPLDDHSEIVVLDDGTGMADADVRQAYLIVGRDRRKDGGDVPTGRGRKVMGRKGIGKFSAFGIAREIEVETIKRTGPPAPDISGPACSRWIMNLTEFERRATDRVIRMPAMAPSGTLKEGTRVTLRNIGKFRTRRIPIGELRRGLARRFSVIGAQHGFEVVVNGEPITPDERDLKRLLDKDADGQPYLWEYDDQEIAPNSGWKVTGWIGALDRTPGGDAESIQRGVVLMARGKMVQEPFVFDATVGQQYALSYLIGELHADFVDEVEDTIATTRNTLVWDTESNAAFKQWGQAEVNKIARQWAERRQRDNEREFLRNPAYVRFKAQADRFENKNIERIAERFVKEVVSRNLVETPEVQEATVETTVQFVNEFAQFDAFQELASELTEAKLQDVTKVVDLFRRWELLEAREMMRVTEGRIKTIEKLQGLIDTNALEVPTLHKFLREFPWVLDPRWTLIADELHYSVLLRRSFPEEAVPEDDRRIDFLCVRESDSLIVVEIKRPKTRASVKELAQIEEYVAFMREHVTSTTDPEHRFVNVVGYLLTGEVVDTGTTRQRRQNLEKAGIYVRRYDDLLRMVEKNHREFLERYEALRKAKKAAAEPDPSPPTD